MTLERAWQSSNSSSLVVIVEAIGGSLDRQIPTRSAASSLTG